MLKDIVVSADSHELLVERPPSLAQLAGEWESGLTCVEYADEKEGELRLGERLPTPVADKGEMTLWFHLECGAYKRPEPLLEDCEQVGITQFVEAGHAFA